MTQTQTKDITLVEDADVLLRRRGLIFIEETDDYIRYGSEVADGLVKFELIFDKRVERCYYKTIKAPEGWMVATLDMGCGDATIAIAAKKKELGWKLGFNEAWFYSEYECKCKGEPFMKKHTIVAQYDECDSEDLMYEWRNKKWKPTLSIIKMI